LYGRELTGSVSSPTASRFGRVWSGALPKGDEDIDNDWDEGGYKGPAGNGEGFEFDDDVDFASPFLIRKIPSQLPQNWKRLERWGYNTSASKRSRQLTVSSKCIEAHGIVTEYIFSHLPVPRAPDLDRVDSELTTLVLGISIILFKSTLYKALGEHIGATVGSEGTDEKCPLFMRPRQ